MRQSAAVWTWVTTVALVCLLNVGVFNEQIWAFNEAPMLAKMVKEGALPSVEKRLPETPSVLTPVDKPGSYGGTWRRAYLGLSDLVGARRLLYDPLVRWSPTYKIEPNLALKWDIDPEGRIFTFHSGEGSEMVRRRAVHR